MSAGGRWLRLFALGACVALVSVGFQPKDASARAFFSFGIGVPLAPAYYPPTVYYPPPAYYVPPAPPVVYAQPPATYYPPPAPAAGQCREYQSTTTIDGHPQQVYGTACLQADGTWRIVR